MRHFSKQFRKSSRPDWASELLTNKVHEVLQIEGESAALIKTALLAGLCSEQASWLHKTPVCSLSFVSCNCNKLHHSIHQNDMIFLTGCYCGANSRCFAVMPQLLFRRFRALQSIEHQIELASKALEQTGISFDELAQIFLAVQSRSNIDVFVPQSSVGIGTFDAVQDFICAIVNRYCLAWEQRGVILRFE